MKFSTAAFQPNGIRMYPRLLSPRVAPIYQPKVERVNSGIVGLDEMIDKGFCAAPGLFVGFQENPAQMARIMLNPGWNAMDLRENDSFEHLYRSPVEMQLDSVAAEVFERVRAGKVRRMVIAALDASTTLSGVVSIDNGSRTLSMHSPSGFRSKTLLAL